MQIVQKEPCVYILASGVNGTLYIGVTARLFDRVMMHKEGAIDGFTKRYNIHRLVYYEIYDSLENAQRREKQLKEWNRQWKIRLIEEMNPEWHDLFDKTEGIVRVGPRGQGEKSR